MAETVAGGRVLASIRDGDARTDLLRRLLVDFMDTDVFGQQDSSSQNDSDDLVSANVYTMKCVCVACCRHRVRQFIINFDLSPMPLTPPPSLPISQTCCRLAPSLMGYGLWGRDFVCVCGAHGATPVDHK